MKLRTPCLLYFLLCISIFIPFPVSADIIFVDKNAAGSETGTSWTHAHKRFQDGLEDAEPGDEIWVAKGKYLPDTEHGGSGPEYTSFQMKNGVRIFGGFDPAIGDILFNDRDWNKNEVILSGDIGYTDWDGDNALHVFYHPSSLNLDTSAVLDGVTISNGFARASQADGGGMFNSGASPTIRNCTFRDNKATNGAGMCNDLYSNPIITHTRFIDNTAKSTGGGMVNFIESNAQVDACQFIGNRATDLYSDGGGMRNHDSEPLVTNTLFLYNRADFGGGAMNSPLMDTKRNPVFINCTFYGNIAGMEGGGIYNYVLPTRIANCIFWENSPESISQFDNRDDISALFSNIQMPPKEVFPGLGNINTSPLFHSIPVFLDYTIEESEPKWLVVADASIYAEGDIIEIDNDDILRKVLKISDNIIIIEPMLSGDSEKGMQIKNWKNLVRHTEDFHIAASSPCVDKGSNLIKGIPLDDFEYEDRIIDGDDDAVKTADMGLDEFNPNAIIYVDQDATGANIGTNWKNAFTDLQDALDSAGPGDQIWVAAGTYTPSKMMAPPDSRSAAFQLKNNVVLYGGFNPDTGDKEFPDRNVTANPTILSGETGDPSSTYDNSFHVLYHPSDLALNHTAVLDGFYIEKGRANDGGLNEINQRGGGMYNKGCSPAIQNCHFRNNSAIYGGGIYIESASPYISSCTFSDNTSTYGGGIYTANSIFSMSTCQFGSDSLEGNTAYQGGGIYIGTSSNITAANCLFRDNSAQTGGGVYCSASTLLLTNTDMLYNECDTTITGEGKGAGIYMTNTSANLNDLSISHNFAYRKGGGIYGEQSTPALHNVLVTSNHAQNGGGLYFDNCSGRMEGDSAVEANTLVNPENGGGMYLCNGTTTEFDSITIFANSANGDDSLGGGVYCNNASPVFLNCRITDNTSGYAGGGVAVFNASVPYFQGCFIDTNEAVFWGGGIYIDSSDPLFSNCSISHNKGTHVNESIGGGIACLGGSPILTDCILDGNSSTSVGGGILVDADISPAAPILTRCTIQNNIVSSTAGGYASGGGMYIARDASPVLDACLFDSNQALGQYSDSGGGGVYNFRAAVTMHDCIFNNNEAAKSGGAVYSNGASLPVQVTRTQFSGNRANDGKGGAYLGQSDMEESFFNFCLFESNSGSTGGGMYLSHPGNTVVNSLFRANTAINGGGLMINNESEPIHIIGSLFTDNLATTGGALYLSQADPYIENCTIVANDITDAPFATCGGILNDDASPIIRNSIIYGNASEEIRNLGSSSPSVTWSDIQGGYGTDSDNNLNTNPRLDTNFRLRSDSPLINAGNNSFLPADMTDTDHDTDTAEGLPLDIFNGKRLTGTLDIGADEYEPVGFCRFDVNSDGDVDGSDLAVLINGALEDMADLASEFGNTECSSL